MTDKLLANPTLLQPAEWTPHAAVWLAWPSHGDLWQEDLKKAQHEFTALCEAIADVDPRTQKPRGETLNILVPDPSAADAAEKALGHLQPCFFRIPFGDIWLRDTAPIFLRRADGVLTAARFNFNGWGGKYVLPYDSEVSDRIAGASGAPEVQFPFVLEGGSIEGDGEGTCLTTKQCLLNPNRNPDMDQPAIEKALAKAVGAKKVLWLNEGLLNDHTDGHIDTLARFVAPGVVICAKPMDRDDPNWTALTRIEEDLKGMTDAQGRRLQVETAPSPGRIEDEDGRVLPASYMNFYIGNTTVVVPVYGSPFDTHAVQAIGRWFPGRRTVGLSAKSILTGGGAFHCISQQQPV